MKKLLLILLLFTTVAAVGQTVPPDSTLVSGATNVGLQAIYKGANASTSVQGWRNPLNQKYYYFYSTYQSDLRYVPKTFQILNGYGMLGGTTLNTSITKSVDTTLLQTIANFYPKGDIRYARLLGGNIFSGLQQFNGGAYVPYNQGFSFGNSGNLAAITLKLDNQVVGNKTGIYDSNTDTVAARYWVNAKVNSKLDTSKKSITTTIDGLRNITNPQSDVIYQTTDYGTGKWFWNASDTRTDNTGTIVKATSITTGRFNRSYDGSTVYADWFGVIPDDGIDDYLAMQAAVNFLGGNGKLNVSKGTVNLDRVGKRALVLPHSATGIIIQGEKDGSTIIKLSVNTPALFDLPGSTSTASVITYQNITIRDIRVDVNNVSGASYGAARTVAVNASGLGNVDVNIGDNTSYAVSGAIFMPYTNSGTSKGTLRKFTKKAGSSTLITIEMKSGDTFLVGDTIKGAVNTHMIIGNNFFNYNPDNYSSYNAQFKNITLDHVTAVNVPPADPEATYITVGGNITVAAAATERQGVDLTMSTSTDQGVGGYSGIMVSDGLVFDDVRINGGAYGIRYIGSSSSRANANNYVINNTTIRNLYHTTGIIPTNQFSSGNIFVGYFARVNNILIDNAVGEQSGDVGIELDNFVNATVSNTMIRNAWGGGYFTTNDNLPSVYLTGPLSTTLSSGISGADATMTVVSFPSGVSKSGYATINKTELVYYKSTAGSNTLSITRGLNSTSGIAHSSAEKVEFYEENAQVANFVNCSYENTLLGNAGNSAWSQGRNFILPLPRLNIQNSFYKRNTAALGTSGGEVVKIVGNNPGVNIDNLDISVPTINYPTSNNAVGSAIGFLNTDGGSGGLNSELPASLIRMKGVKINVSGTLDNSAIAANNSYYNGILFQNGNYNLDIDNVAVKLDFTNTNRTQSFGISFGYLANYITGRIRNFKFSANGDDAAPIGIFVNGSASIRKLFLENLDFSDMKYTVNASNSNYRPYSIASSLAANVFVDNVIQSKFSTSPLASLTSHQTRVAANYTALFDDNYIGVTSTAAARTITLPLVETTASSIRPNYGVTLTIADESYAAATNNITITPASGEKINNSTSSITINTNGGGYTLESVANGWIVKAVNKIQSDAVFAKLAGGNSFTGTQTLTGALDVTGQITQNGGNAIAQFSATPIGNPSTYNVPGGTKWNTTHDGTTDYYSVDYQGFKRDIGGSVYTYTGPARSGTLATTTGTLTSGALSKFDANGNLVTATAGTDYQAPITLTTTGTSGAATLIGNTLNIPNYASGGGTVSSVSGTSNRITSTGGTTPVIDISASYIGQSSITTLGTIGSGTWQGTAIADSYISSAATWSAKQAALSGTGLVKSTSGTISYITDNSTNWDTAYGWGNHAGLYPLYNGTGATGTWGINISGNAATATSLLTPGYVLPYRFENGASYSATTSDSYIHVIGGACLITLPSSGSGMVAGQTYIIKNKASGTTTVEMSGNAVGIDGSANTTIGVGLSKTFTYTGSYFSVID